MVNKKPKVSFCCAFDCPYFVEVRHRRLATDMVVLSSLACTAKFPCVVDLPKVDVFEHVISIKKCSDYESEEVSS